MPLYIFLQKQHGVLDDDDEEDNDNKKGATENTASRLSANSSDELSAGDHSSEEVYFQCYFCIVMNMSLAVLKCCCKSSRS